MMPLRKQFFRFGADHGADTLRADLHDASGFLRGGHHLDAVLRAVRHRLLAINVLAGIHRVHHHLLVPVVRHRRDDAVDVLVVQRVRDNAA